MTKGRVLVVDSHGAEIAPTSNANARRLLRDKEATVFNKNPFTIKINKEIIMTQTLTPREVRELFKSDEDVYVQNISNPIAILMLTFRNRNGQRIKSFKGIPANRDPICLSDYVTNEQIRDGSNIQGFLNPSQTTGEARIKVITKEVYDNYYKKKVVERKEIFDVNTTSEELEKEANREVANVGQLKKSKALKPTISSEAPKKEIPKKDVTDKVNPKTRGICDQLNPDNVEKPDMTKIIDDLNNHNMKEEDLRYILANSFGNGIVNKWASSRLQDIQEENSKAKKKKGGRPKKSQ